MSIVAVDQLTYTYPGAERPALDGLTLEVERGELIVLAGRSASGKSTLLRAVAGLVPHFHGGSFGGHVRVCEMDTRDHGPGELAGTVATLFQDPETQVVMGTVRAELSFGMENRGAGGAELARAVEETALALAIDPLLERPVSELSGGELQRVALGATLAGRPVLACLDEPTSQLDPVAGDELIGLLRRLNEDLELTVLLAEHRLERCLPFADRVIALEDGRLAFDGSPASFLEWALAREPALATPGSQLLGGLRLPPVPGVRRARAALRQAGVTSPSAAPPILGERSAPEPASSPRRSRPRRLRGRPEAVISFERVWHELREGPAILRGFTLEVAAGERIALMGANGSGKSTTLRHAAGLLQPTRGRVRRAGRVGLLLQNPNDYLVHDTVGEEAPAAALTRFGLEHLRDRHPRDLSGGQRQRLALGVVLGEEEQPAAICLDEPTRGMDRHSKLELAGYLRSLPCAVVLVTHDPEFAVQVADRVLLMANGRLIADGAPHELLATGTYFATEVARILDGAALTAADGIALLARDALVNA